MDATGGAISGEWSSLSGMYTNEEVDFMAELLSNCSTLPDELNGNLNLGMPSTFWSSPGAVLYCSSDNNNSSSYSFSQGGSFSAGSSILFASSSQESYYLGDSYPNFVANNSSISMEDAKNTSSYLIEADACLNQETGHGNIEEQDGKKQQEPALPDVGSKRESEIEKKSSNISENSKKRSRTSGDIVQKNRKYARSKKNQSSALTTTNNDIEDGNAAVNGQSSDNCSSEDESNASQELNGGGVTSSSKGEAALNSNGKTRAGRGAATDPQSLYARKRRERINERLRILQNLVPNGTKVDISTMLEEAVQYVKFLQLQIKLLSSDDLWMYAPIAYNGMDVGLNLKVGTPKQS